VVTNSVSSGTNSIENAWIEPSTVDTIAYSAMHCAYGT
jgi:hypothetical protein